VIQAGGRPALDNGRVSHFGEGFVPGITLSHDELGFFVEGDSDALLALADAVEQAVRVETPSDGGSPASLSVTLSSEGFPGHRWIAAESAPVIAYLAGSR
jgi:hypothetical protein